MSGGGSVVVRRQLGSKLRKLRLAAGKDVADVTEAGLGSKAKISRIETGKGPVKIADVRALCWLYGADPATTEALAALAPGTQQEDWWQPLGAAVVPDWFGLYAGLEATASKIRSFEPQLVHGLVQTPEYARAVIGADPRLSPEVVEQRVRFRMERQQTEANVSLIMGEGALSLVAGSPEIMAAQIERLRTVAAKIYVLPFSAGAYPRRGSFALLDFEDDEDPSVAYVEGPGGARYFDRADDRAEYEFVWKFLLDKSIPIKEWTA
jgi:transcriptional regulator with XRE-family HTH domain